MRKKEILYKYRNGNVDITLYDDGTKVMEYEDDSQPYFDYPTSFDLHITNKCLFNCPYCHEKSNECGDHGDLGKVSEIISELPHGEIAIGGGDALLHPDLEPFLKRCKKQGLICNVTVNQRQLNRDYCYLRRLIDEKLIYGIGISASKPRSWGDDELWFAGYEHTVIHLIIGIHTIDDLILLRDTFKFKKFLLLGYKKFGRGLDYYENPKNIITIDNNIKEWDENILKLFNGCIISFDNLAIEQLDMSNKIPKELYDECYCGDDFTHTMYIDSVKEEYAPTSRSPYNERVSFDKMTLKDYFQNNKRQF
jgi:hypothetical protein